MLLAIDTGKVLRTELSKRELKTQIDTAKPGPSIIPSQRRNTRAPPRTSNDFMARFSDSSSLTALSDTECLINPPEKNATRLTPKIQSGIGSDAAGALLHDLQSTEGSGDSSDSNSSEMIRELLVPCLK